MSLHLFPIAPVALGALIFTTMSIPSAAQKPDDSIVPQRLLVISGVSRGGRSIVPVDAIQALRASGAWKAPKAGDSVRLPDGTTKTWQEITPSSEGTFEDRALAGGYAYWRVESPRSRVMLLEASGHGMAFVNGEPRPGDPYAYGYVRLPVQLKKGANEILVKAGRGRLTLRLTTPSSPLTLDTRDATLPDLPQDQRTDTLGAVVVVNASTNTVRGAVLEAITGDATPDRMPVPAIPPLSVRKVAFRIVTPAINATEPVPVRLQLREDGETRDQAKVELRVRKPGETYKRTFISRIDGSVQYYAVNPLQPIPPVPPATTAGSTLPSKPAAKPSKAASKAVKAVPPARPALILSLHGASVEAIGQADAYSGKTWATLVAPTNRRPYGYDWEDWGRIDALEVLEIARSEFPHDPSRVYLTGHSMGGHGTWQVGALCPDLFAAIGPSAGWISAETYAGGSRAASTPVGEILRRANLVGDTKAMAQNYAAYGVYILHGDADDNVPVTEARSMRETLQGFHHDFVYHEEPGQGHWWDLSDEPGADCVDWAPMWDFFNRHALPPTETVREVRFATANPGVTSRFRWATIEAQEQEMRLSSVDLKCDPWKRRFTGTTQNVARLALDVSPLAPGAGLHFDLDGQALDLAEPPAEGAVHLLRKDGRWSIAGIPPPEEKGPARYGPFRTAFDHHMLFVIGTRGTKEENAWALAQARYDAETFWYRGNGSIDIVRDTVFDASITKDRGVILYGNADTNDAWGKLLADSPVLVNRGSVRIGNRTIRGEDLACLFLRPRKDSESACVGVVAPTGPAGMVVSGSLNYLQPMIGFPDVVVVGADALTKGEPGIRAAGFFGRDWGVPSGDFTFQGVAR